MMWKNKFKTILMLGVLTGVLLFVGGIFGGNTGIQIACIIALLMNGITYFFSDKIVLSLYGAQALDHAEHPHIVGMIEELSSTMNLPMPKLWIIRTPAANAFATGRNPRNGSIAITTGILNILEPHELRGVLAHEMSHIYNRDILIGTMAATLATAIGYLAHMAQNAFFWGSFNGNSNRKHSDNLIGLFLVAIFMPIAATILQLSISRSREYLADETGAHACHDPLALASALRKLHNHVKYANFDAVSQKQASTASLFIVHPFTSNGFLELFSTHPPLEKRIERLQRMYENECITK